TATVATTAPVAPPATAAATATAAPTTTAASVAPRRHLRGSGREHHRQHETVHYGKPPHRKHKEFVRSAWENPNGELQLMDPDRPANLPNRINYPNDPVKSFYPNCVIYDQVGSIPTAVNRRMRRSGRN